MAEKVVNYTPEQEQELTEGYKAVVDQGYEAADTFVRAIAEKFGKSAASIRAKLVRAGLYKAKEYVSKTGEKPVEKAELATAIGNALKMSEPDTESLTKANKKALTAILHALANSVPVEIESDEDKAAKPDIINRLAEAFDLTDADATSLARVRTSALAKLLTI